MDNFLKSLLVRVVQQGASDLHLSAGNHPIFRLHGSLVSFNGSRRLTPPQLEKLIFSFLSEVQKERLAREKELDVSLAISGLARFRCNVFYERDALGAVFRVIPSTPPPLEDLGVPLVIRDLARRTQGLILVTGPSGSGKTTTLAAVVEYLNSTRSCHVVTIEDPIEYTYVHKKCLIRQREVGVHTNSFPDALRAALRQDPDVILVGEMRDLETISTVLTAAETGHLVLSTLHTNGAVDTVNRIIDVFPDYRQEQVRVQLATTLLGVFSQVLVPRRQGRGRALATEVMINTSGVRNLIRDGRTHQLRSALETGREHGMQTMEMSLAHLVQAGSISPEEAVARAFDPVAMRKLMS